MSQSREESSESDEQSDRTQEIINRAIYGLQRRKIADKNQPLQKEPIFSPKRALNPLKVASSFAHTYFMTPRSGTASDTYTTGRDSLLNRARQQMANQRTNMRPTKYFAQTLLSPYSPTNGLK